MADARVSGEALQAYRDRFWQAAIEQLEGQQAEPGAHRMLALAYFHALDFDNALPALRAALGKEPGDMELNIALLEVLVTDGFNQEAMAAADRLERLGAEDVAALGRARVLLAQGEQVRAGEILQSLVGEADPEVATRAADVLVEMLYEQENFGRAFRIARTAAARAPDSELAYRFSRMRPEGLPQTGFRANVGYRLEYDDNVTFPDDIFSSGRDDWRHVLQADLLYERPIDGEWGFHAEGHFFHSLHDDLDQFDQTRIAGAVALGRTGRRLSWRLPLEFSHDRLDGEAFRSSVSARPGLQTMLGEGYVGHFYARLQRDDYDLFQGANEDRSGGVTGAGALLIGRIFPHLKLRSYVEFNRHDADGLYWERDEFVVFALCELELKPDWIVGLALRYQDEEYDHVRPVFAERQQDESREIYLNLTHRLSGQWQWRGQISRIDHDSNIPIFDYERNVFSFSVVREF